MVSDLSRTRSSWNTSSVQKKRNALSGEPTRSESRCCSGGMKVLRGADLGVATSSFGHLSPLQRIPDG
jgi:hypothetical protein